VEVNGGPEVLFKIRIGLHLAFQHHIAHGINAVLFLRVEFVQPHIRKVHHQCFSQVFLFGGGDCLEHGAQFIEKGLRIFGELFKRLAVGGETA